jgi:ppGpp synthetase/RelA/SpoT-type nucleotidyltranferase
MSDEHEYSDAFPLLELAAADLGRRIGKALRALGDPMLIRGRVEANRIKQIDSIQRKAKGHGWSFVEGLEKSGDLVGYRVVCHNLQDVHNIAKALEESLRTSGIDVERVDYVGKPQSAGYRAIHLVIRLPISAGPQSRVVGCEIQVRSLLQHSWAELSRTDIYTKEEGISSTLLRLMARLAQLLQAADEIANDIRDEISKPPQLETTAQPTEAQKFPEVPTGDQLTLGFITTLQGLFRREFKRDAGGYLLEAAVNEIRDDREKLERLAQLLRDRRLRKRLRAMYKRRAGWDPDDAQVFRWVTRAATQSLKDAFVLVRAEADQERAEMETIADREMLSDLPEDWHELVDYLEHPRRTRTWTPISAVGRVLCRS